MRHRARSGDHHPRKSAMTHFFARTELVPRAAPFAQSAWGTTAVTSISTFARSSINALTSTALIATS